MKKAAVMMVLSCLAILIFGACALPLGEDFTIARDTDQNGIYIVDYDLQSYVPVPVSGAAAVQSVSQRGDLEAIVTWKDRTGNELPNLDTFLPNTVYQAEIKLTPRAGYLFNPAISFAYHPGKISAQNDDRDSPTRTVTVTYHNSNDGNITYIVDYDLQNYVPIPVGGEEPVRTITTTEVTGTVSWKQGGSPLSDSAVFQAGQGYGADIRLQVQPGYRFSTAQDFGYPPNTVTTQPASNRDPLTRSLSTVSYKNAAVAAVVDDFNLDAYITSPVTGVPPNTGRVEGTQYTAASVSWSPADAVFNENTSYTATVILTAKSGYTFNGLGSNVFSYTGASTVVFGENTGRTGTVTIIFPNTAATVVNERNLTTWIPAPVLDGIPVKTFEHSQYTGTVTWSPGGNTAWVILNVKTGYTFTGLGTNAFTHNDCSSIGGTSNTGSIYRLEIHFSTVFGTVADDMDLSGAITNPVTGNIADPSFSKNSSQYACSTTVIWEPSTAVFAANTVYTARIVLDAQDGRTFAGLPESAFTYSGSTSISIITNRGTYVVVEIVFPATASATVASL